MRNQYAPALGIGLMLTLLAPAVWAQPPETSVLGTNPANNTARLGAIPDLQPGRRVQFVRGADRDEVGQGVVVNASEQGVVVRLRGGSKVSEGDVAVFCPARGEVDVQGQELRRLVRQLRDQAAQSGSERHRVLAIQLQTALDARSGALRRGACDTRLYDSQLTSIVSELRTGASAMSPSSSAPPAPVAMAPSVAPAPVAAAPPPSVASAPAVSSTPPADASAAPPVAASPVPGASPDAGAPLAAAPSAAPPAADTAGASASSGAGDLLTKLMEAVSGLTGSKSGGTGSGGSASSPGATPPSPVATSPGGLAPAPPTGGSTTPAPPTSGSTTPAAPPVATAPATPGPPASAPSPKPPAKAPIKSGIVLTLAGISGRVLDERGHPVLDALVTVDETRNVRAGGDGKFALVNLTAGTHQVVLSAQGFRTATRTVTVETGRTTSLEVTLQQLSAARQPPSKVLTPTAPPTMRPK